MADKLTVNGGLSTSFQQFGPLSDRVAAIKEQLARIHELNLQGAGSDDPVAVQYQQQVLPTMDDLDAFSGSLARGLDLVRTTGVQQSRTTTDIEDANTRVAGAD